MKKLQKIKCPICLRVFVTNAGLSSHIRATHPQYHQAGDFTTSVRNCVKSVTPDPQVVKMSTDMQALFADLLDNLVDTVKAENTTSNMIEHPPHYGGADDLYEAIKVIEAWQLGFNLGNTVKYIARADHKNNPVQDLEKAEFYLKREITRRKGLSN